MKSHLDKQMQSYIAETCIGASALRNQGAKNLVKKSRAFFKTLDLASVPRQRAEFEQWLDQKTDDLCAQFPSKARRFGAARKAMNLFLRSAAYNIVLNRTFSLKSLLPLLELPLDSYAAKHLRAHDGSLPGTWLGLKALLPNQNSQYQETARRLARQWRVHRVDLDVFFYREEVHAA